MLYARFSLLYISTNKVAYSQPHPNKGTCSATNPYSTRPRTTRSWGGMVIFDMQFRSQRVSRIPWTFIAWRYIHQAILFYLSIPNAVNNILRSEPFLVVFASSHSTIP